MSECIAFQMTQSFHYWRSALKAHTAAQVHRGKLKYAVRCWKCAACIIARQAFATSNRVECLHTRKNVARHHSREQLRVRSMLRVLDWMRAYTLDRLEAKASQPAIDAFCATRVENHAGWFLSKWRDAAWAPKCAQSRLLGAVCG